MKVNLLQVLLVVSMILIILCVVRSEPRRRVIPNVNFKLDRKINKSNPRKQELMHVFSNMEVPGWKWGNVNGGGNPAKAA
tara:strand:+ start:2104 stop:2343 length:240 start_codon:yes stop_codon:yes gene_type:complete